MLALCACASLSAQGDPIAEVKKDYEKPPYIPAAEPEVRASVAAWQDLKFGMFIHWGPYSQWGIVESWSICPEQYAFCMVRPKDKSYFEYLKEYEALKTTFNPVQFTLINGPPLRRMRHEIHGLHHQTSRWVQHV